MDREIERNGKMRCMYVFHASSSLLVVIEADRCGVLFEINKIENKEMPESERESNERGSCWLLPAVAARVALKIR